MADIFLSYAREDERRARVVAAALEARGWSVWWDSRIPHGKDFGELIQQQLDASACVVVLWSQASVKSQFVRDEATEGLNGRLVPVLIEVVKPPLGFRQLQAADLTTWNDDSPHREFDRLLQSIESIVSPSGSLRTAPSETLSPPTQPMRPQLLDADNVTPALAATDRTRRWMFPKSALVPLLAGAGVVAALVTFWPGAGSSVVQDKGPDPVSASAPDQKPSDTSRPPVLEASKPSPANATPPSLDEARVAAEKANAQRQPTNAEPRVNLGNLYFDAERWSEAATWYADALRLSPADVNVLTDLGVCYYYLNQPDNALEQFERALRINPRASKTLLNAGIVKAFGKQDLDSARADWQKVVELAPNSPEGEAARRALEASARPVESKK